MVESFQVATIEGGEQPEMDPFAEERALWDESNAELQALVHRQEHVPRMKGLKFDPPSTPVAATVNFKERYDPIQQQVTTLLMRHGKLAKAQTVSSFPAPIHLCR